MQGMVSMVEHCSSLEVVGHIRYEEIEMGSVQMVQTIGDLESYAHYKYYESESEMKLVIA